MGDAAANATRTVRPEGPDLAVGGWRGGPGATIIIHPCIGNSYDYFGFRTFSLTRVGRSAALAVQINRMGVIDRLSQGASGKSRLRASRQKSAS
jgi:hypothetical protein